MKIPIIIDNGSHCSVELELAHLRVAAKSGDPVAAHEAQAVLDEYVYPQASPDTIRSMTITLGVVVLIGCLVFYLKFNE